MGRHDLAGIHDELTTAALPPDELHRARLVVAAQVDHGLSPHDALEVLQMLGLAGVEDTAQQACTVLALDQRRAVLDRKEVS